MNIRTIVLSALGGVALTTASVPPSVALENIAQWVAVLGARDQADQIRGLIPPEPELSFEERSGRAARMQRDVAPREDAADRHSEDAYIATADVGERRAQSNVAAAARDYAADNARGWFSVASNALSNTTAAIVTAGVALLLLALLILGGRRPSGAK